MTDTDAILAMKAELDRLRKTSAQMCEHLDWLIGCLEEVEHGHDASLAIEASKSVLTAARGEQ